VTPTITAQVVWLCAGVQQRLPLRYHVGNASDARRDDRNAGGHGLQQNDWRSFRPRAQHHDVEDPHQPRRVRHHPVRAHEPVEPVGRRQALQRPALATLSHDAHHQVPLGEPFHRFDEHIGALLMAQPPDPADVEHVVRHAKLRARLVR
jgi:hypothetical protein